MKCIVIPCEDGLVASHFGHARQCAFFRVDEQSGEIHEERVLDAPPHEPGRLPAWIAQEGGQVVLAGGMGGRAVQLFGQQGIEVIVGIQADSLRMLSMLLSAFFTGISGACYAHLVGYINPALVYGIHFSAIPMIFAICGGRFTIIGPALAALIIYPLDQFIFHPLIPAGHEFLYGAVLIFAVLFMPAGLWGSLHRTTN